MSRVLINDITLRDGEQTPGVCFFPEEKLAIARSLLELRVPIIEAGFAVASESDFAGIELIAREIGRGPGAPVICAMARATRRDIDAAAEALRYADLPRIQVVLATSDLHLEQKLGKTREEVIALASSMTAYARTRVADVEFAAEDATRSDRDFLHRVLGAALDSGARTLELPDTVGYATPEEYAALVRGVVEEVCRDRAVIVSTHCHDDLGLATANTLAGIRAGARQAEVTINGLGERAGNACLEEVVMALKIRAEEFGVEIDLDTRAIMRTSRVVCSYSEVPVAPNKAIVGRNAFVHESGIHQHGMLRDQRTYQIIDPRSVGVDRFDLRLGKLSGRHALRTKIEELGYEIEESSLDEVYARFKNLAARQKRIVDADVSKLVETVIGR